MVNCLNTHWTAEMKQNDLLFYVDRMKELMLHEEASRTKQSNKNITIPNQDKTN